MQTVAAVLSALLAAFMLVSAVGKLTRMEPVVDSLARAGVTSEVFPLLATIQVVGALGLLGGIWVGGIGLVAAIGFVVYFVAACVVHVRAGDTPGVGVPAGLAAFALVVAVVIAVA